MRVLLLFIILLPLTSYSIEKEGLEEHVLYPSSLERLIAELQEKAPGAVDINRNCENDSEKREHLQLEKIISNLNNWHNNKQESPISQQESTQNHINSAQIEELLKYRYYKIEEIKSPWQGSLMFSDQELSLLKKLIQAIPER